MTLEDLVLLAFLRFYKGLKFAKKYGTIICYHLLSFVVCLKIVYGIWNK